MKGWERNFDDPIPLPKGRALKTLADARAYILRLKKADQDSEPWQTAAEALLMAAEGPRADHACADRDAAGAERRQAKAGTGAAPQARQGLPDCSMKTIDQ
jgi:hypothetical protein